MLRHVFAMFLLSLGSLTLVSGPGRAPSATMLRMVPGSRGMAAAGRETALFYSSGVPQSEFAVHEILAALEAKGQTCVTRGLGELPQASQEARIAMATTREESQQLAAALGVKPLRKDSAHSPMRFAGSRPAGKRRTWSWQPIRWARCTADSTWRKPSGWGRLPA